MPLRGAGWFGCEGMDLGMESSGLMGVEKRSPSERFEVELLLFLLFFGGDCWLYPLEGNGDEEEEWTGEGLLPVPLHDGQE